jgi:uncharacterized membrane protein
LKNNAKSKRERRRKMDFEKLIKTSFDQFLKNIVKLILFVLVGGLLSCTIILIPTVAGGLVRGILKLCREGTEPEFSELWNFDGYLQILLLMIIGGIAVFIGLILLIIPGIVLMVWWMYSIYFIVDANMGFSEAMSASKRVVTESGFWNNLGIMLIMTILNSIGSSLAGLGTLVTAPFGLVLLANAYLTVSSQPVAEAQSAPVAQPKPPAA